MVVLGVSLIAFGVGLIFAVADQIVNGPYRTNWVTYVGGFILIFSIIGIVLGAGIAVLNWGLP